MKFFRLTLIAVPLFIVSITTAWAYKYIPWQGWVTLSYSSSNASSCSQISTPPGYPYMLPGANVASAYGFNAYNSGWFTFTCSNGAGSTSSSDYLDVSPAPSIGYFGAADCIIPAEGNNCFTHVWWGIANPQQPRVFLDGNWAWAWGGASGDYYHDFGVVGPGSHTYSAWDVGGTMQTLWVTKSCAAGSTWNGSICSPPPSISYFGATGCTIPVNGNDCNTHVWWGIAYPQQPRVYLDGNWAWAWGGATGDFLHNFGVVGPGWHTYTAWDVNGPMQTLWVEKACAAGSTWNGSICSPPVLGYLVGTSCTIPANANNCSTRVQWNINYPQQPRVYLDGNWAWAWPQASGDYYHDFGVVGQGMHSFTAWDMYGDLQTVYVTKTCAVDTQWNGSVCAPASGTVAANPVVCLIPFNGSTCPTDITFTTQNTPWAQVWVDGSPFLGGTSGAGTYWWMTNGSKIFYLRNGNQPTGTILSQVTATGKCTPGSKWNGSVCAPTTGAISANPQQCTIAQGANTCSTAITYSTANADSAKVFAGNTLFTTGLSGTNMPYNTVPFGSVNFTLKNNSSDGDTRDLAAVTVSGTCGGANEFDATKSFCVPPTPIIEGTVSPGTIPYNGPVSITWSIQNPNNSCKIQAVIQKPVTCNATCQADVTAEQTALNSTLASSNTNQNDPNGSRNMTTALTTTVSGVYAKGVKTVNVKYSTEFQFTCNTAGQPGVVSMPSKAVKKIIYVIDKNEG